MKTINKIKKIYIPRLFNKKNKGLTAVLALFLGTYGVHKFYLGDTKKGILYLVFCWSGIPTFLGLYDAIRFLSMNESAFDGYCLKLQGFDVEYVLEEETQSKPVESDFSRPYYNALKVLSYDVSKIVEKLRSDYTILSEFGNNPQQISDCIAYDMVQIFVIVYGMDTERYNLEAFGLALLLPTENSDMVKTNDYDQIAGNYDKGKFKEMITGIIAYYSKMDNPLLMNSGSSSSLSLPSLLKQKGVVHFNEYSVMLERLAKTISTADEFASPDEQIKLHNVYQQIFNPPTA